MPKASSASDSTFPCDQCGKTFTRRHGLTRHLQTHLPEEDRNWYQCQYLECTFRTLQKSNLENHIHSMHTLEPIAFCEDCGRGFRDRSCLSKHRKRKHGMGAALRRVDRTVDYDSVPCYRSYQPRRFSPTSSNSSGLYSPPPASSWSTVASPSTSQPSPVVKAEAMVDTSEFAALSFWPSVAPSPDVQLLPIMKAEDMVDTVQPAWLDTAAGPFSWPQLPACTPADVLPDYSQFDFSMPEPVSCDFPWLSEDCTLEVSMGSHMGFDLFQGWDWSHPLFTSAF
ncbi:hypothetical protein OE88DRAFT_1736662 [Heliocybe sulcata]|uniref:C2H2-type domain-containing protein n=1 Tax=Heliocybe sulcata TaxID=5364 RepID=A0A5C3MXT6_9AGAM|nr:hypothetical protein OE88DRAFT_1736662 [Heliocybe sulcata]